jgi:hypothetical protein
MAEGDLRGALAVPDTEAWWRAVLQVCEEAEQEALDGARIKVANDRACVNSLGMADGARLVRDKLISRRAAALESRS